MLKWLLQTLPGICFTIADLAELNDLIVSKNIHEFSLYAYLIFMFANLAGFIYTNKLYDIKSFSAWIIPAFIEMVMMLVCIWRRARELFYLSFIGTIFFLFTYFYIIYTIKLPTKQFGIIPSILAPIGELTQLYKIYYNKGCHGVSKTSWLLQCLGNIGLFFLIDTFSIENYLISVIPAILDSLIVFLCFQVLK